MDAVDLSGRIAFIGCGTMGTALITGIISHQLYPARNLFVYDQDPLRVRRIPGVQCCSTAFEAIYNAGIIFVCVKPQDVREAFMGTDVADKAVVSIAAGLRTDALMGLIPGCKRVMRVMPNMCLTVDQAATAYCVPNTLNPIETERVLNIFRALGTVEPVEEKYMDTVTALSGSGPAYFVLFIHLLAQAAAESGLPYDSCLRLATQTAYGTAELIKKDDRTPNELIQAVCSSKGTTGAAMSVLDTPKFRSIVDAAVEAATTRSKEMGEEFKA